MARAVADLLVVVVEEADVTSAAAVEAASSSVAVTAPLAAAAAEQLDPIHHFGLYGNMNGRSILLEFPILLILLHRRRRRRWRGCALSVPRSATTAPVPRMRCLPARAALLPEKKMPKMSDLALLGSDELTTGLVAALSAEQLLGAWWRPWGGGEEAAGARRGRGADPAAPGGWRSRRGGGWWW